MPKQVLAFLLLFYWFPGTAKAQKYTYDYNDNCSKAYQAYLSLHTNEARAAIINEMKANPYNLMATYISDYEDCTVLLLNYDKADYAQRKEHLDARLKLLEKGDEASPWYRLCLSGIYLHWALVDTRFGEQYKAAIAFHKSMALLKENQRLFPRFEYNNVFAGLQEAVVGSLPGNYKWIASIFGMKGNVKKGTGLLASFVNTHTVLQPLYAEAALYNVFTRFLSFGRTKRSVGSAQRPAIPNPKQPAPRLCEGQHSAGLSEGRSGYGNTGICRRRSLLQPVPCF